MASAGAEPTPTSVTVSLLLLSLVSVIETFQDEPTTGGGVVVRSLVLMLLMSTLTALRYNNGYTVDELSDDVVRLLSLSDDVVRLLLYSALTAAAASGAAVAGAVVALMMFFTVAAGVSIVSCISGVYLVSSFCRSSAAVACRSSLGTNEVLAFVLLF